jgi:hypothetical protein
MANLQCKASVGIDCAQWILFEPLSNQSSDPIRDHAKSVCSAKIFTSFDVSRQLNKIVPLLCLALLIAVASEGAVITRGPYLQRASSSNIVVRWRTDTATSSRVRYGTNMASLSFTQDSTATVVDHEILIASLASDTRYYYTVGTTTAVLASTNTSQYFLTHPQPGTSKPMRVWVIGDAGTGTTNQLAVRNAFYTYNGNKDVNVWLQLGDNAYNTGTDAEYQTAVFNVYSNQLRRTVTWPTLGNHDTAQSTNFVNTYPYFSIFTLPAAGECGGVASGTEHYYSFDHGMVHFICLDSMTASRAKNGAMATWLQTDLATTTNHWIVAYWHHPPYTKGSHDSDTEIELMEMRENFLPILEAGGVDLVLSGHSHVYERSLFISRHYGLSTSFSSGNIVQAGSGRGTGAYVKSSDPGAASYGTVYAVAGCSGQATGGTLDHPAMYISLNNLGSMVLDIRSNRLDAVFLRENGATNDWFTVRKDYPLPNNTFPIAANDSTTTLEDVAVTIPVLANDRDADGDRLAIQSITQGTNGTTAISGTNVVYRPPTNWNGSDSFTYVASDGRGGSATGRVSVTVLATNDAPSWTSNLLVFPVALLGNPYSNSVAANAIDPDAGNTLTFTRLSGPTWLDISPSGALAGVPRSDALGTNTWTLQASDGHGSSAQTTLRITVVRTAIYEAELATLNGAAVATTYAGYSGSGYADYAHNNSDYVQWTVPLTVSGNYSIAFRYALITGSRPLQITVNGQVAGTVAFPSTGAWTTWSSTLPLNVILNAGNNTIRASATGSNGANVDYLALTVLTNPPVAMVFTQMAFTNRTLTFTGTGPNGGNYRVWATTNITAPATNWSIIASGAFNGGVFTFTDSQSTNFNGRFYRLSAP